MIENGITDGLDNYFNSTIIDHNGLLSNEIFTDLGIGIGLGISKGFTSTYLEDKWVRPELEKFKNYRYELQLNKGNLFFNNIIKNSYNPIFSPERIFPSPSRNKGRIPYKN